MTFSVLLVKDDQSRVVGTLWADDESNAQAVAPMLCGCAEGEKLNVRRAEGRWANGRAGKGVGDRKDILS